jgi:DNA polymerase-3 subunit gamma/tau
MALQHEFRPETLEDFENNEELVEAVQAWFDNPNKNHTILITGNSGCGKTTLARIIASMLEVYDPDASTSENIDFTEINSADLTGVDTIREIRKKMYIAPVKSKYKIYFLDEIHKASPASQEALFKPTEDTPEHVFFILATSELNKIKVALRRRCIHFNVNDFSSKEMTTFLHEVCEEEEKKVPKEVINQIVHDSIGSPGIALSILDAVINLNKKSMLKIAKKTAEKESQVISLCRLLINPNTKWDKICSILKGLKQDPESIRRAVLGYMNTVLLSSQNSQAYLVIDSFKEAFYNSGKAGLTAACYAVYND